MQKKHIIAGVIALATFAKAYGLTSVSGWPYSSEQLAQLSASSAPAWLHSDPLVGRLACPSLARRNARLGKSELLLLQNVSEAKGSGGFPTWEVTLKTQLYWWSGSEALGKDLAEYLQGLVTSEAASVKASGPYSATITWKKMPETDAPTFAERPLSRAKAKGFECVGLFAWAVSTKGILLTPSTGYTTTKRTPIEILAADSAASDLRLAFAGDQRTCAGALADVPYFTSIVWNKKSALAKDADVRRALTQLLPRGEILRVAANGFGELVSAPIMRSDPGYNETLKVRPYAASFAPELMLKYGWNRKDLDSPLTAASGAPLVLKLHAEAAPRLLEKIISDAYAVAGMAVKYVDSGEDADGTLGARMVDWAGEYGGGKPISINDSRALHAKFFEREPESVLFQHKGCITRHLKAVKADTLNPDWVRDLLLK